MITAPCNLKCPFCYGPPPDLEGELSLNDKKKLVISLHKLGVEKIVFAGGEPLLSPDILELCKYTHSLGMKLAIQTNGFFVDKLKQVLIYLDWVALPLDGVSENAQERMRTSKNHLDAFLIAVQAIQPLIDSNQIRLKVGTVVSTDNIDELEEIAKLIDKIHPSVWKIYQIRERGKGITASRQIGVSDLKISNQVSSLKEKYKGLNIYLSTGNGIKDSYMILNPDSELVVINSLGEFSVGKLLKNSEFSLDKWNNALKMFSIDDQIENIKRSFPGWL